MFYVKEKINDSMEVSIEITDENVFCRCPMCGVEFCVDIADIFNKVKIDLYGTDIYCLDCSKSRLEEV